MGLDDLKLIFFWGLTCGFYFPSGNDFAKIKKRFDFSVSFGMR